MARWAHAFLEREIFLLIPDASAHRNPLFSPSRSPLRGNELRISEMRVHQASQWWLPQKQSRFLQVR